MFCNTSLRSCGLPRREMLHNLAGQDSVKTVEEELRKEMDRWMVREGDGLPLASEAVPNNVKANKE